MRIARRSAAIVVGALVMVGSLAAGCDDGRSAPRNGFFGGPGGGLAEGGGGTGGSVVTGPCTDGDSRSCEVDLGVSGQVKSCLLGTQTCVDGAWSRCEGSFTDSTTQKASSGFHAAAIGTAQPCTNNACDPACQVYAEAPPGGSTFVPACIPDPEAGGELTALPGGFEGKLLKDFTNPPSYQGCNGPDDCQADSYCDPTICLGSECGKCVPWADGEFDPSASGPNLTMRTPCQGNAIVCNRGSAPVSPGALIAVIAGNSSQLQNDLGKCTGLSGSLAGTCSTLTTIDPGECEAVPGCPDLNGTKGLVVNSPVFAMPAIAETECSDNWAVYGTVAAASCKLPVETTQTGETYGGNCPPGQLPQWGLLTYQTTLPAGTRIELLAQTASSTTALSPNCADCVVVADIPNTAPEDCDYTGPSPCPFNMYDLLGANESRREVFELQWRLISNTSCETPTLVSWDITYSCVDVQ